MRLSHVISALAVAALVQGCSATRYQTAAFDASYAAPYQLSSGDRLRVIVFGQDSLSNSYSVNGTGNISMPLIGDVPVRGQSTAQLERAIEARLRGGFLREPKVSVEVEAYRPFFVLGEVTASGQYPYVNGMTVQNAIAIAGGFTPRASQTSADLTRIINGQIVTAPVPLSQLVRPGDTVTVRERLF